MSEQHPADYDAPCKVHKWVFDGYFWHHCRTCGAVS